MRTYELMLMFSPDYTEAEVKKYTKKITEFLTKHKASNLKEDFWGKRDLAYKIRQFTQAYYVVMTFDAESSLSNTIREFLRLEQEVLRHMITLKPVSKSSSKPKKVSNKKQVKKSTK